MTNNMIRVTFEILAAITAMIGGIIVTTVAGQVDNPFARIIVEQYGPIGVAVFIIYRKQNRLEKRIAENREEIDEYH